MLKQIGCIALTASALLAYGNDMFEAYAINNYPQARTLAKAKGKNDPEARLILSLTKVYDKSYPEKVAIEGLHELGDYMRDKTVPAKLRRIAALSYARCAQLMQDRQDIYGTAADKINYTEIYQKIIEENPNSSDACIALFYMRPELEDISRFGQKFQGDKRDLVPLYLYAANESIKTEKNFKLAISYLKDAYRFGISHPSVRQATLFRIGFLYDKKLNDFKSAEKYYREFIQKYPLARNTRIIKRYMKEHGVK